jgi:hypothetical protein
MKLPEDPAQWNALVCRLLLIYCCHFQVFELPPFLIGFISCHVLCNRTSPACLR